MAAQSDLPETEPDSGVHNSVLIRTHEPMRESHAWLAPALIGVAIVIGAAIWGFMATHPAGPIVNHSVAKAPTAQTAFSTG
ncbi:MAG TPA: hypothetical protein VMT68_11800 [Caulobacteraceae bacterium]|nr:hypothetical protein [Caulobacteraceae bacterium]